MYKLFIYNELDILTSHHRECFDYELRLSYREIYKALVEKGNGIKHKTQVRRLGVLLKEHGFVEIAIYGGKDFKASKWIESISRETGRHALCFFDINRNRKSCTVVLGRVTYIDERIKLDTYYIRVKKSLLVFLMLVLWSYLYSNW